LQHRSILSGGWVLTQSGNPPAPESICGLPPGAMKWGPPGAPVGEMGGRGVRRRRGAPADRFRSSGHPEPSGPCWIVAEFPTFGPWSFDSD
jgi:hypothetical protein